MTDAEEEDALVKGVRLRRRSVGGAPSGPDRRAWLDHRRAAADRNFRRPLARSEIQLRTVLDRPVLDAGAGARMLVRLEMDGERMSLASFEMFPARVSCGLAAHLAAGIALGALYFEASWNVRQYIGGAPVVTTIARNRSFRSSWRSADVNEPGRCAAVTDAVTWCDGRAFRCHG